MNEQDIKRRSPVWCAMADLFLDTELQPHDHQHIAREIKAAGYSPDEAEDILRTEVAPVFHMNLCSVAGEWTSWNEADVREMVLERLAGPAWWQKFTPLRDWVFNRQMKLIAEDWQAVRKYL